MQQAENTGDEQQRVALGKAIVIRRTELGLRRRDLHERAGLSYPFVAELEQGAKGMSQRSLELVARALELRPSELLAMADALTDDAPPPRQAARAAPAPAETAAAPGKRANAPRAPTEAESVDAAEALGAADAVPSPRPPASSRWFRARRAAEGTRARAEELRTGRLGREPAVSLPPAMESRVREIVREELRRAGIDAPDEDPTA